MEWNHSYILSGRRPRNETDEIRSASHSGGGGIELPENDRATLPDPRLTTDWGPHPFLFFVGATMRYVGLSSKPISFSGVYCL